MASNTEPKMDIIAQCLCKRHTFTASISPSSLPLEASYCHCNSCRHVTGAMYSCDAPWPGPQETVLDSTLAQYDFTKNVSVLFCATCSSPMFFHEHYENRPESLGVFIGVLTNHAVDNFVRVVDHIFVEDTIDGGATPWLMDINADGTPSRLWKGRMNTTEELEAPWPGVRSLMKAEDKTGPDLIPLQCHCKGVNLTVRRMDSEFLKMKDSGKDLPWFVNPENLKHLCGFDPCDSCRPMFGVDIVHWTFVLIQQVEFAENNSGKPFPSDTLQLKDAISGTTDRDPRLGTLSLYASSPDVQRYFCSRCSASVFYAVDDRPEMLDVAAGLLWAPEGARAESLLAWDIGSAIGNAGDVQGGWREKYVQAVRRGAEKWRIQRGYPKSWRRINAEKEKPELLEDFKDLQV